MGKCKTCSKKGSVSGIEDAPYMLVVGSIGAALVADKIDEMATKNADGTPKADSYLYKNPKIKNVLFVAAGVGATMYAGGNEAIVGAGVGLAVWGGYNLVKGMMTPATTAGLGYIQPASLGAVHVPGNAGFSPSNIGRMNIPKYQQQPMYQEAEFEAGL